MRLIDADLLMIRAIQKYDEVSDFLDLIDEQPTAYNVDKVIDKIGRKSLDNTDGRLASHHKLMGSYLSLTWEVVDIIEKGGINE